MSVKDCLARIQAAAGKRKLSEDEIADLTERVEARKARLLRADPSLAPGDAYARAGDEIGTEIAAAAAIERRNQAMNLEKRIGRRAFYDGAPGQGKTPGIVIGLKAKLGGVNTPFARGRLSVDAQAVALKADYSIGLITDLEDAGLLGIVRRGEMDDHWAAELAEMSRGAAGKPGITGNARALEIARIVDKYKRLARADANRAGAWIGEYEGHIDRTSHDPDRIRRAGYAAWKASVLKNLDPDRTFEGIADPEAFLANVYDGLVTGIHFTVEGKQGFKDPAFKGPKNLAAKLSEARVLHWRDAAAWMDYQRAFGTGTLIEGVLRGLEHSARGTALMREFGTNPRAEFEADLAWLRETRRADHNTMQKLRNAERGLVNVMNELDGTALRPQNRLSARIGSSVRSWVGMSKLGGVVLSALGDVPLKAAELRYNDVNLFQAYGDGFASILRGRPKGEQREIARLLRAGFETMRGDITSRFDAADTVPGQLAKVQNTFFKATGIGWWTDAQRAGLEMVLSRHLGLHSAADHAALPAGTARVLGLYGIGAPEWNALRSVDWHQADGRRYLTPDIAAKLSDSAVDGLITDKLAAAAGMLDARRRAVALAEAREAQWLEGRIDKIRDAATRAQEWLAKRQRQVMGAEYRATAGAQDRIALLRARIAQAEVETDIGASLRGMDTQDQIRVFLDKVEEGDDPTRIIPRADRAVEKGARAALAAGENLGARRRAAQERIKELEARIFERAEQSDATLAEAESVIGFRLHEMESDLRGFRQRSAERMAERRAILTEMEERLPGRIEEMRDGLRRDLELRLLSYFSERGRFGVIEPGANERAMLRQGTEPGTALGEAMRFMTQFKAFPVAVISRAWGREFYGGQGRPGAVAGIVHMAVASTVFGYMAMSAKDIAKGRTPRDASDPKTWAAAFVQGGGAGIFGDFIVGEYSRFGRSLAATAAGPTLGQLDDVAEMWNRVKAGDDPSAQAFRFMLGNTPFANLFYLRPALDYLFLYQVQEALSPGFLRRFERRVERENKQDFILSPAAAIPRGGGDRIFEGVR